jgi:acyl-CoA oxidase
MGLMTTATFDAKSDEFVIHTPEPKATKWWPGEMGRYANYAIVFAQLLIPDDDGDKNNYGVAPFIVQLRSLETHKHMPGVKTGDMGPKLGYHGKDNGWATFDQVRIPRDQML